MRKEAQSEAPLVLAVRASMCRRIDLAPGTSQFCYNITIPMAGEDDADIPSRAVLRIDRRPTTARGKGDGSRIAFFGGAPGYFVGALAHRFACLLPERLTTMQRVYCI
jgi:hypothetical protein